MGIKSFLSGPQRQALLAAHRQEKNRRSADRLKAILWADEGWSYQQIAKALFIDQETASKHVKEYIASKKISLETGGSTSKLDTIQSQELITHLETTTYLKVKELCKYVATTYDIDYTIPGMTSWLKKQGFTYKKAKPVPAKADQAKQEAFKTAYQQLKETTPANEPILFLDGVHPSMATQVSYGWIRKGKDKPIASTASRTRMNIVGSINLATMEVFAKDYTSLNSGSMIDYFAALKDKYSQYDKLHIILDQGPYNVSQQTRKAAEKENIILHYLPPYSPNLNPIERLWKVLNEEVRNNRVFESAKGFKEAIMHFLDTTWQTMASSMRGRINDNFQTLPSG